MRSVLGLVLVLAACAKSQPDGVPDASVGAAPSVTWTAGPAWSGPTPAFDQGTSMPLTDFLVANPGVGFSDEEVERILSQPIAPVWWGIQQTDRLIESGHLTWNVVQLSQTGLHLGGVGLNLAGGSVSGEHLRGNMIAPLYEELVQRRESALIGAERLGLQPVLALGLQAEPSVSWQPFMQTVYTAGQAGYESICLLDVPDATTGQVDAFCVEAPTYGGPDTLMPPTVVASAAGVSIRHTARAVDVPCVPECDAVVVSAALGDVSAVSVVHSEPTATLADGLAVADLVKGASHSRIVVAPVALTNPSERTLEAGLLGAPAGATP